MSSLYPVYREIAQILQTDPKIAYQMHMEQLHPIISLSLQAPNVLLDMHTLKEVQRIYEQRGGGDFKPIIKGKVSLPKSKELKQEPEQEPAPAPKVVISIKKPIIPIKAKIKIPDRAAPAPPAVAPVVPSDALKKIIIKTPIKIPPRAPAPVHAPEPAPEQAKLEQDEPLQVVKKPIVKLKVKPKSELTDVVQELNTNHRKADDMSQDQLEDILRTADKRYYMEDDEPNKPMLEDKVYDYIKRIYNQRRLGTNDKEKTLLSISSKSGVGIDPIGKPVRGRDTVLPFILLSLDNLYMGEGDVASWAGKKKGPYVVSAKMDGTSALYHNNILYTRGNGTDGRNISHLLPYLKLPQFSYGVRGELVMDKNIFNAKYKGKSGSSTGARKTVRNSVAGAIGAINHMDAELLSDLQFVAYEIITTEKEQIKPSIQYQMLEDAGFTVANHILMQHISDDILTTHHHQLLETYPYEIDGLVLLSDYPYFRATDKNPDYAKAFKDALTTDVAVSVVTDVEWNVSQYGYLIPTIVYKQVTIAGVDLNRAGAHNAREIVSRGLGPGAEIEVIYWAKVNPRIHKVLKPVAPSMPKVAWKWVPNGGEPSHIIFDEAGQADEDSVSEMKRDINVRKIHKFLITIDAKGIGEITVGKIYDTGKTTVGDFINMTVDEIAFLGKVASRNIIDAISNAMNKITVPVLMASSKVFARGIGVRKLTKVFRDNPQFIGERLTHAEYVAAFQKIDGFALKTATLTADGMEEFWKFIDEEIPSDVFEQVVNNTITEFETTEASSLDERHPDINGKKICLTGFRNPEIQGFIEKNGGQVQNDCNGSTSMVVRATDGYNNNKTSKAEAKGIPLLSQITFKQTYMNN